MSNFSNTCATWFKAKVAVRNTVRAWMCHYGVPATIGKHIQTITVNGATQKQVEEVVKASNELCHQVGF